MFQLMFSSQGETVSKAVSQPPTHTMCSWVSLRRKKSRKKKQSNCSRWAAMDPETIQAAKKIVNKRGKGDEDSVEGRLAALECKLDGVQAALQDLTKMLSKSKLMK